MTLSGLSCRPATYSAAMPSHLWICTGDRLECGPTSQRAAAAFQVGRACLRILSRETCPKLNLRDWRETGCRSGGVGCPFPVSFPAQCSAPSFSPTPIRTRLRGTCGNYCVVEASWQHPWALGGGNLCGGDCSVYSSRPGLYLFRCQ